MFGVRQFANIAIAVIAVAAIVAIVYVACSAMGVAIPGWVVSVLWIIVVAVVCVAAVQFLIWTINRKP